VLRDGATAPPFFGDLKGCGVDLMWWLTSIIPSTQEAEVGRTEVRGGPGRQLLRPLLISTSKPGVVSHVCNPSYKGGSGRRITLQGCPWAKMGDST
jgi:hypothetical protein